MKIKAIREMSEDELAVKASDLSEELFKLKFQHSIRALDSTAKLAQLKKDIARIKTIASQRQKGN